MGLTDWSKVPPLPTGEAMPSSASFVGFVQQQGPPPRMPPVPSGTFVRKEEKP